MPIRTSRARSERRLRQSAHNSDEDEHQIHEDKQENQDPQEDPPLLPLSLLPGRPHSHPLARHFTPPSRGKAGPASTTTRRGFQSFSLNKKKEKVMILVIYMVHRNPLGLHEFPRCVRRPQFHETLSLQTVPRLGSHRLSSIDCPQGLDRPRLS